VSWVRAAWQWYSVNAPVINPIGTFVAAVGAFATAAALAWAGVQNARTAARRHEEQTNADRQRRITESFSNAVEQLASEKIEVRLGGIYALERISKESPDDHWVVMETLTAFVREHARWKKQDEIASETLVSLYDDEKSNETQPEPTTDIAAVLAVIVRREIENRDRERLKDVGLNFRGCDLEGAFLGGARLEGAFLVGAYLERADLANTHLEGARLIDAHLQGAYLVEAHLERAFLTGANLKGANLEKAHLEGAGLLGAYLEGANLVEAHLEEAFFSGAHLEGANLEKAHLEGADLARAEGLVPGQITQASGDSRTILPEEVARPEHWPSGS
jgi:hypothetical protein